MTNLLVIMGHPSTESYNAALADSYIKGATDAGHEVRSLSLHTLKFDPILHEGYSGKQALEPDLEKAKADIEWAQHLCFIFPTWWYGMPALLKGFLDRILLPGFAFKFTGFGQWDKLLSGRSAEMLVTMGNEPVVYKLAFGETGNRQLKQTLEFCGIEPVKVTQFGPVPHATERLRELWLLDALDLGKCVKSHSEKAVARE